ncbi:MAG: hypothetical protein HY699_04295 [Deltaproteobacteria bacterium]|nr:hypothetical protein [Deltaproteobacteria bacterium]
MKRGILIAMTALLVMVACRHAAMAGEGLFFYDGSHSRFVPLAVKGGDSPWWDPYGSFGTKNRAPFISAPGCADEEIFGAFTAQLVASSNKSGLLVWSSELSAPWGPSVWVNPAVREGDPVPGGGFFGKFTGVPAVAMDPDCKLHVIFRAQIMGLPATQDTAIFDWVYAAGDLSGTIAENVVAQEGMSAAYGAGTFLDFPSGLVLVAAKTGSGAIDLAYWGKLAGTGVSTANDTGIFWSRYTTSLSWMTPYSVVREGVCTATWAPGFTYDGFSSKQPLAIARDTSGVDAQSRIIFRGKAKGAPSGSDTAIVLGGGSSCPYVAPVAVEGAAMPGYIAPAGTFYGDFPDSTLVALSKTAALFYNKSLGTAPQKRILHYDLSTTSVDYQAGCDGCDYSGLGNDKFDTSLGFAVDDSGRPAFTVKPSGYPTGLFAPPGAVGGWWALLSFNAQAVETAQNFDSVSRGFWTFTARMP